MYTNWEGKGGVRVVLRLRNDRREFGQIYSSSPEKELLFSVREPLITCSSKDMASLSSVMVSSEGRSGGYVCGKKPPSNTMLGGHEKELLEQ